MPSRKKKIANKFKKWGLSDRWPGLIFLPFLLLATLFWLSSKLSNELQYRKEIFIGYHTTSDVVLKDKLPEKLVLKLFGKGWDLFLLQNYNSQNPFRFQITPDKQYLTKSEIIENFNVAFADKDIQVLDVNFIGQKLHIEPRLTKKVPVLFSGTLSFGTFYKLKSPISFIPDSVTITGPVSAIENTYSYAIISQSLEDVEADITKTVALEKPGKHYIEVNPMEIQMHIEAEQLTQKTIRIPVQISNPGSASYNIVPREIEISFLIGLSEFNYIAPDDFTAQIMFPSDRHTNQQYAVSIIKKPSNATIQKIAPAYVDVFIDN